VKLLTPKETAERLQVSDATLRRWRINGDGPPFIKVGPATYRYSEQSLTEYMAERIGEQMNWRIKTSD
jgi:excisionase family DNA binding protein